MSNSVRCNLCPRKCGIDRSKGRGVCGGGDTVRAARAMLHFWEEPCISGIDSDKLTPKRGSGTVFFSGCPLKCCFCQNHAISSGNKGKDISVRRLGEIFSELEASGAYNINLVSPTHFAEQIRLALDYAKPSIPVVYNTGGYETVESLQKMEGYVDIYLTDIKFMKSELSERYCKAPNYYEYAIEALGEMLRQVGKPEFDENGILKKGVIVRHLVMPGCAEDSIKIIKALDGMLEGDDILLSIMSQYVPMHKACDYPEINRRVSKEEYQSVMDAVYETDFEGYFQDSDSATDEYTPEFDFNGIESAENSDYDRESLGVLPL